METLYHGSPFIVSEPKNNVGRDRIDFGKGFYLTRIELQAQQWAANQTDYAKQGQPTINIYEFNREKAISLGYKILVFETYNDEWLDFVIACRSGKKLYKHYDIIEGGIADDRVFETIEFYINNIITREQALGRLLYNEPTHQICFINQQAINNCLTYKSHYTI